MDELLLRRAQRGDAEAFEQLMTPLEKMVWRVCWHYTGDREAASDCGQDTMLRIWRALDSYRMECAFETWVYRVAANCCMDYLRKKKRESLIPKRKMEIRNPRTKLKKTRQNRNSPGRAPEAFSGMLPRRNGRTYS